MHLISPQISFFKPVVGSSASYLHKNIVIYKIFGKCQYILMDIEGKILIGVSTLTDLSKHFYEQQKAQLVH